MAIFLSKLKAQAFAKEISDENTLVITADTIVCLGKIILGKPENYNDAVRMLKMLSGKKHEVITAVSLTSKQKQKTFFASSYVYFKKLSDEEINFYITNFKPYDKAGAYGVQDWIGFVGIKKIVGSYFNVMGLPVKELYEELKIF